jgi:beta-glucosidase
VSKILISLLAYTNFTYADLTVDSSATSGPATGPVVPGGAEDLFEEVATVTASITNSGDVTGAEVAQLYIAFPASAEQPPRQLRGFTKLPLEAGASGTATFALRRRDLSVWNTQEQVWTVPAGEFGVQVGASSRDIRLEGTITVS